LQNAASIASLILTADVMVAELQEKEAGPGAMGEMEM
jgi:chaperonin GroEL (HSP60 family)